MLELRRQAFHLLLGIVIVALVNYYILNLRILLFILLIGIIISFLTNYFEIPGIQWFLDKFDRKNGKGFGVITYFIGVVIVLGFFRKDIALASILILAFGDSFCHLGRFGKIKNPLNKEKLIEGLTIGVIAATIAASFFVSVYIAFIGSLIAMILESLDLKIRGIVLDDNILVPLSAAIVMSLV
ncbi:hypothetical protein J4442_05380 [Candidatus Woesearchaeota archaeon]|nr:hypothetical protein [Candidatus Woesearchaeota archaeon]